jgi:hypothetical protein
VHRGQDPRIAERLLPSARSNVPAEDGGTLEERRVVRIAEALREDLLLRARAQVAAHDEQHYPGEDDCVRDPDERPETQQIDREIDRMADPSVGPDRDVIRTVSDGDRG